MFEVGNQSSMSGWSLRMDGARFPSGQAGGSVQAFLLAGVASFIISTLFGARRLAK
jgi:hypothetical protein